MLKREVLLSKLGITEEQVKELNLDVDSVLAEVQTLGDGIANKNAKTISNLTKEIETLKTSGSQKVDPHKNDGTLTPEQVQQMIAEAVGKVTEETNKEKNTNRVNNFKKQAKELGYSPEQIEGFVDMTMPEKLETFNFGLFPLSKEDNVGGGKDEDNQDDDETLKLLGLK